MSPKGYKVVFALIAFGENCNNIPNSEIWDHTQARARSMYREACRTGDKISIRIARQVSDKKILFYESIVNKDGQLKIVPCIQGSIIKSYYLGTCEVLQLAKEALDLGGNPNEFYIVCHRDHKKRVKGLALKLGFNRINKIFANVDSYDPREPQWWCRYRFFFLGMEIVKTVVHYIKGEL